MKKILVRGDSGTMIEKIRATLEKDGAYSVCAAENEKTEEYDAYDAVLILSPAVTQKRAEEIRRLAEQISAGILVLVRADCRTEAESLLEGAGVMTGTFGPGGRNLPVLASYACKMTERLRLLSVQNERLKSKISDLKLIDRAKCTLVQYLNMSENDAHRFIEKQAMNRRLPKREIALEILKAYEPL